MPGKRKRPKFREKDACFVTDIYKPDGKPTDNAFIESFNARFRLECLNEHWFLTLDDV